MKAGSVGDDAWRKRGKMSLATGPVAAAIKETPGGGGTGMFEELPEVTPRKMESAASPIALRAERKTARPTINPRQTLPTAIVPPSSPAVTQTETTEG